MLKIKRFTCENQVQECVTDNNNVRFGFTLESDRKGASLKKALLKLNNWECETVEQISIPYLGEELKPFTKYTAFLEVEDDSGEKASETMTFETGRLNEPWQGKWITDGKYIFKENKISPVPMVFRKVIETKKTIKNAKLYVTAMGCYEFNIDGEKVGTDYFAPGFTSYKHSLQYQAYDITCMLNGKNTLEAVVGGGWAVGAFVFTRKNRISADRQALLAEVRITYTDNSEEIIGTDETWLVTMNGKYKYADFYDGETYDAGLDLKKADWHAASLEKIKISPEITATYGALVKAREVMKPISCKQLNEEELIYDFGQNFAGVVRFKAKGRAGQIITIKHAEVLKKDGSLNTELLRSAKATVLYICSGKDEEYSPRLTYMGFRYISVRGIKEENIDIDALALYSDIERTGDFSCSNQMLNKLNENILWSAKSNFMDIPTDCPQRDERMGWTGDIALFSPTACYNFDMSRFLDKWLKDVRSEQLKSGGIPNTIPVQGYGFPATMPVMAVDFWGDACILVPWAEYLARGDKEILKKMYPTMKRYVRACKFWAGLMSFGKKRYIWNTFRVLHFGDWVAPDVPKMSQWQARSKWTATSSLKNTSGLLAKIADILNEKENAEYFSNLSKKVSDAYQSILSDGNGRMKQEFQTAYVLPLQFGIFKGEVKKKAADNLEALVRKNDYCIGTGFPGTPYILFALADNGHKDAAFKMLLNTKCPSWLYQVKVGATTVWERWDGLNEDGICEIGDDGTGGMISYNHYASGAVGDFLYRRIGGIETIEPAYKRFRIKPIMGGDISWAKASVQTPYGTVSSDWKIEDNKFVITIAVPMNTVCELTLPSGRNETVTSGTYTFLEEV